MIDALGAQREAARLHPGLPVLLEGEGQFTIAVRVGEELLLRFPRHEVSREPLGLEVRLLDRIRPKLSSIDVPEVLQAALDEPIGRAHVTHRYLPGSIVDRATVAAWSPTRVREVGERVGQFLVELHELTSDGLSAGVPERTARQQADALDRTVDELLARRMTAAARARAARETGALRAIPDRPAVLCHTDLGGNLLFDESSARLTVIDFGDSCITHPAFDLASVSVLGDAVLDDDAAVVAATFALQDACNAATQDDWAYVDEVLAAY